MRKQILFSAMLMLGMTGGFIVCPSPAMASVTQQTIKVKGQVVDFDLIDLCKFNTVIKCESRIVCMQVYFCFGKIPIYGYTVANTIQPASERIQIMFITGVTEMIQRKGNTV